MISQTTTNRSNRTFPSAITRGFTLIELLLVVTMLGILAAVVYPRLKTTTQAASLEQGTQILAEWIRFARTEALRRHLKIKVEFSSVPSSFRLYLQKEDGTEGFAEFGDSFLDTRQPLPQGIRIEQIKEGEQLIHTNFILFEPINTSPYTLTVSDRLQRHKLITLGTWADDIKITNETKH